MTASGLPFDDFRNLLRQLPGPDETAASVVRRAFELGGREAGALGRLEEIAVWLAAWTGRPAASPGRPLMAVFAGTHGVSTALGTPDPIAETQHRVERLAAGAAALNRLCSVNDLSLKVFDLALDMPVEDISLKAAMDERGCAATMAFGMEAVAGGTDLICIGDLGVDNDVPAAAIFAALFGGSAKDWTDAGAERLKLIDAAINFSRHDDPLEVLRRLGGREIAAIAGAILAARIEKVPVILDGFATTAAAAILHAVNPAAIEHCLLAGSISEPHRRVAERLGVTPLLDFGVTEGEGTGAALAAGIVKAAAQVAAGFAEVRMRSRSA